MSRGYRFAVSAAFFAFAVAMHYLGVEFFRPDGPLWDFGTTSVGVYIDAGWQDRMYKVFAQYVPLALLAFAAAWPFLAEYEDQTTTRRVRR